jgi:hypothetical protein
MTTFRQFAEPARKGLFDPWITRYDKKAHTPDLPGLLRLGR